MKYDNKSGMEIESKYPNEGISISDESLMAILGLHGFSKEEGVASLTVGDTNLVTYYSGKSINYYVGLILNKHENTDEFEDWLKEIAHIILENLQEEKYINMLPALFTQITSLI